MLSWGRRLLLIAEMGLSGLMLNRERSALSILMITIGVGAVIVLTSWGNGVQDKVIKELNDLGSNLLWVSPGNPAAQSNSPLGSVVSVNTLTLEDVKTVESLPTVVEASGSVLLDKPVDGIALTGVDPSYVRIRSVDLVAGRFVEQSGEIVLEEPVAKQRLDANPQNALGKTLTIKNESYGVVGVVKAKEPALSMTVVPETSFVITEDAFRISGAKNIGQIFAKAQDTDSISKAEEEIRSALKSAHGGEEDFDVATQEDLLSSFNQITAPLLRLVYGISGISLLLVGLGVMITMGNSVAERTKEIGLRKAVGATDADVLFQFLFEALFLISIGGAIGIVLGWGISMLLPEINPNLPTSVSGASIVLAFGVSALVGLISGILPAIRAARLEPVEALRSER